MLPGDSISCNACKAMVTTRVCVSTSKALPVTLPRGKLTCTALGTRIFAVNPCINVILTVMRPAVSSSR